VSWHGGVAACSPLVKYVRTKGGEYLHQENHFYPGTNMFVSFFPGFHKASQDVLGQPELS
jgi:hypothetical protein